MWFKKTIVNYHSIEILSPPPLVKTFSADSAIFYSWGWERKGGWRRGKKMFWERFQQKGDRAVKKSDEGRGLLCEDARQVRPDTNKKQECRNLSKNERKKDSWRSAEIKSRMGETERLAQLLQPVPQARPRQGQPDAQELASSGWEPCPPSVIPLEAVQH